jgi:hypothetical protein
MNRCELPVVVMVKLTPEQYNKIRKDQTSRRRQHTCMYKTKHTHHMSNIPVLLQTQKKTKIGPAAITDIQHQEGINLP